jgi:hypothetical protein
MVNMLRVVIILKVILPFKNGSIWTHLPQLPTPPTGNLAQFASGRDRKLKGH